MNLLRIQVGDPVQTTVINQQETNLDKNEKDLNTKKVKKKKSTYCSSFHSVVPLKHQSNNMKLIVSLYVIKVELFNALKQIVVALQEEKDVLRVEQQHHQALGTSIETLVQECLKTNERDKYNMLIGETADCHCIQPI